MPPTDPPPTPQPAPPQPPEPDPAKTLAQILPKKILIILSLILLALAIGFLMVGMFRPEFFTNAFSRVCLRILIALCLSYFFFILYVQRITIRVPFSAKEYAQLSGPVALFIVLLVVFRFLLADPLPPTARLFYFVEDGTVIPIAAPVHLQPMEKNFNWWLAKDKHGQSFGIVIEFAQGVTKLKGKVNPPLRDEFIFTFERGEDLGTLELSARKP